MEHLLKAGSEIVGGAGGEGVAVGSAVVTGGAEGDMGGAGDAGANNPAPTHRLFVIDHLTLLVGVGLPLFLHAPTAPTAPIAPLALYSGLLSVGVGDSAAAIVGRLMGGPKWKGY